MKTATRTNHFDVAARTTSFPQRKAFVLQFSLDAGPQTGLFRGRIEHVTSGEGASFSSPDELWAFVSRVLVRPNPDAIRTAPALGAPSPSATPRTSGVAHALESPHALRVPAAPGASRTLGLPPARVKAA